jgi:hypothetical protein
MPAVALVEALSVYFGGLDTHIGAEAHGHRARHMMAMAGL